MNIKTGAAVLIALGLHGCQVNPRFSKLPLKEQKVLIPLTGSAEELAAGEGLPQSAEPVASADEIKIYKGTSTFVNEYIDKSQNQFTHLYIYGSFCKPCVAEMPAILQMHRDRQSTSFLMVSPENWGNLVWIKAFLYRNKVFTPTYVLDLDRYGDEYSVHLRQRKFIDEIYPGHPEIAGFPTHFILNKQHKVVFAAVGAGRLKAAVLDSVMQANR